MLARLFVRIGGLFVLALTAALVAPYFIYWPNYRADFEREAGKVLCRKVTVIQPSKWLVPTKSRSSGPTPKDLAKLRPATKANSAAVAGVIGRASRGLGLKAQATRPSGRKDQGLNPRRLSGR